MIRFTEDEDRVESGEDKYADLKGSDKEEVKDAINRRVVDVNGDVVRVGRECFDIRS